MDGLQTLQSAKSWDSLYLKEISYSSIITMNLDIPCSSENMSRLQFCKTFETLKNMT